MFSGEVWKLLQTTGRLSSSSNRGMKDSLKFIYANYTRANSFIDYWHPFENYLDMDFPYSGEGDSFRKRLKRFEEYLRRDRIHDAFLRATFALDTAKYLAELEPRIFREKTGDTSAHDAFASDYARYVRGQKPKEPICRLLNLLYTVRCNAGHGQKILPDEWDAIRERNELVYTLTTPLQAVVDELIITFFVATGVFAYGTLQQLALSEQFGYEVEPRLGMKIKGYLYDLGAFPGWCYETWGWVHGMLLTVPLQWRMQFVHHCDGLEGALFERRLVIAHEEEDTQQIAWAYHYTGDTDPSQRIKSGVWKSTS